MIVRKFIVIRRLLIVICAAIIGTSSPANAFIPYTMTVLCPVHSATCDAGIYDTVLQKDFKRYNDYRKCLKANPGVSTTVLIYCLHTVGAHAIYRDFIIGTQTWVNVDTGKVVYKCAVIQQPGNCLRYSVDNGKPQK